MNLLRAASTISLFTLASRVTGLVREVVVAALSDARSRPIAGLLPNAEWRESTPSLFFDSALFSAETSLPLSRSSTFTN